MSKKQKIYLETSVISAYFDFWKTAPKQKKITRDFQALTKKKYKFFVSDIVFAEIAETKNHKWQGQLIQYIKRINCEKLKLNKQIRNLAQEYIKNNLIPKSQPRDALHIAFATYCKINFIVSWNQKHITRPVKSKQISDFNYKIIGHSPLIITPAAFVEFDRSKKR